MMFNGSFWTMPFVMMHYWLTLQSTKTQSLDPKVNTTLNSYPQCEVSCNVEWRSLNHAFSYDTILAHKCLTTWLWIQVLPQFMCVYLKVNLTAGKLTKICAMNYYSKMCDALRCKPEKKMVT